MTNRNHYKVQDIYKFSLQVLESAEYSNKKAKPAAFALLEADKRGIFSHGTAGGTGIEESVKRSGIIATVRLDTESIILNKNMKLLQLLMQMELHDTIHQK